MSAAAAEIEAVWLPIKTTIKARMRKLALLCLEHNTAVFDWDAIIRRNQQLMDAVRKLPAHAVDQVRDEFPLSAEQLQLWCEHTCHVGMFQADYNTF